MICSRFEDVIMTTFSQDYERTKHFLIDESSHDGKRSAEIARRFCRLHRMTFKSLTLHKPYDIGPWQHEPIYGFETECKKGCLYWRDL